MRSGVRAQRARNPGTKGSALVSAFVLLFSQAAFAQGPMGPGGGAMTPQPRVAPAAPQAPTMTPQAPVVAPQAPVVAPPMPVANPRVPQPSTRSTTSSSNRDHIDQDAQTDIKKLRVINNSETDAATVEGQYSRTTGAPTGPAKQPGKANAQGADFVNVESSNRDYIKRDVQPDSAGGTSGAEKILRVINNSETGKTEQPIPSVNVMVRKQSGASAISTAKTDSNGQTTFRQLEPGIYDVALPSVPGGTVSMTVFVNGTPASRTDFPVGSSIGTFTVAKASDTVILKFQTNLGTTPVNGVGGTGGGRFTFK